MKTKNLFLALCAALMLSSCGNKTRNDHQSSECKNHNESQCQHNKADAKEKTLLLIDIKDVEQNAVSLIADNWLVVTAGNEANYNPMTISWGALGQIWGAPAATIYIRNTRHTYSFIEDNKYFTLCAFPEEHREKVLYIGSNSGRDGNKIEATGLTPKNTELGNIYYDEANLVIECEKIYFNDLLPENITEPKGIESYKNEESVHRMYIGKILNVWEKR